MLEKWPLEKQIKALTFVKLTSYCKETENSKKTNNFRVIKLRERKKHRAIQKRQPTWGGGAYLLSMSKKPTLKKTI